MGTLSHIWFLVEVMGRRIEEAADYPDFFRHAFKKGLEFRQRLLKRNSIQCSLSAMLDCNKKKFLMKFSLWRTTSVRFIFFVTSYGFGGSQLMAVQRSVPC